ncbi:MAG TPA: extracellular solute-binding protein [Chloroflexota bacterium]|nr:extracellular solute-binding protein [Chloroflexota bacterium]
MLRRQVIVGGVAGLSAVLAAACGPQPGGGAAGGGETAAAPRGVGQTETSLLWQEELPPDVEQGLDAFLAEWRQKYPKVKIEAVNYGGGDSQKIEKILAQAAGGTPVDVVGKLTFMQPLARPGAVRPLEPFIKRDRVDLGQFNKGWLERFGTLDGKLYSLPWGLGGDAMAFIYSTDALREVGLKPPSADWKSPFTYDEYRDYARRLTKRDGDNYLRVGAEGLGNELSVPPREFEGKWLSDDGKTVVCDSQQMVDAYTRYTDLIIKDRSTAVTPGVTLSASGNDGHFSNGQTAMSYIGGWQMNFFTNPTKYKVDYAIATFPKGTKSSPAIDAIQLALGNNTKSPEEAWAFMGWLLEGARYANVVNRMPATEKDAAAWSKRAFKDVPATAGVQTLIDSIAVAIPPDASLAHPAAVQIEKEGQAPFWADVLAGKTNVKDGLTEAKRRIQGIIGAG